MTPRDIRRIVFFAALGSLLVGTLPVGFGSGREPAKRESSKNIALGKPYTLAPRPNYRYCTDPDDFRQLTDGQTTTRYFWTQKGTVGWQHAQPVVVTIDLGKIEPIRGVAYNTAAGRAGVRWPRAIYILVSDDGKSFHEVGDLVALSAKHSSPPADRYALHCFRTDELRTHGRFVSLVILGEPFIFVDEIEIYRGESAWLGNALPGEAVTDLKAFFRKTAIHLAVERRLSEDVKAIRAAVKAADLPAAQGNRIIEKLDAVEREIGRLPHSYGEEFRAVLPLNALHRRIFRIQAELWRAMNRPPLCVWKSDLWSPLSPTEPPPARTSPAVEVVMMRNEYRAGAFNISNASDKDIVLRLQIRGLPGGLNPPYVKVAEVAWTDTRSGQPVAAALPEAKRKGDAFLINVPSGLTRQVWLTFHPIDVAAGTHRGEVIVASDETSLVVPLVLRLYPFRFPDHPTLHLGGWDYTDALAHYEVTAENRPLVVRHLREHFVDSPWATSAVLPPGKYDAKGNMTAEPDTARFDAWLRLWPNARQYCVFASVGERFDGSPMNTPAFAAKVRAWITFWARHAARRGLRPEQLALLLVDEPRTPQQDAIILAWARAIHAAKTGVRIWEDPIHKNPLQADQRMMAECDVLCPNRPLFLRGGPAYRDYFVERRRQGTELAFYSCSGPVRLLDPYSYHRLQAWSCWRYGARGSYFWAFGDSGGASSWNEYVAKRHAYVPYFLDRVSVTPGKHMEAIREGIEDYEYLVMLADRVAKIENKRAGNAALDRARKLLARAADRVCGARGADLLMWAQAKDRTVADRIRIEILESMMELKK